MSHFYGTLQGSTIDRDGSERKTRVTRGASADNGLEVVLRSNEGSVRVTVYEGDDGTGGLEDRVRIRFERVKAFGPIGRGSGHLCGQDFELYDGPISECDYTSIRTNTQEQETP